MKHALPSAQFQGYAELKTPFTQYNLLSNRLSNRFNNRLYRVNGV